MYNFGSCTCINKKFLIVRIYIYVIVWKLLYVMCLNYDISNWFSYKIKKICLKCILYNCMSYLCIMFFLYWYVYVLTYAMWYIQRWLQWRLWWCILDGRMMKIVTLTIFWKILSLKKMQPICNYIHWLWIN